MQAIARRHAHMMVTLRTDLKMRSSSARYKNLTAAITLVHTFRNAGLAAGGAMLLSIQFQSSSLVTFLLGKLSFIIRGA